jgi:hypothetical protein
MEPAEPAEKARRIIMSSSANRSRIAARASRAVADSQASAVARTGHVRHACGEPEGADKCAAVGFERRRVQRQSEQRDGAAVKRCEYR